jgi:16S rRNA (guanine527-N7)-methyltransferase
MSFREEIAGLLPAERIAAMNEVMNLTRIAGEREAAVKHVLDSVLPWRRFAAAERVLDAGTGAGLPGIALAVVLPEVQFLLAESIQKKARFVADVAADLELKNVRVLAERAEDVLARERVDVITARAMAPLERAIPLFAKGLKQGARAVLYKGPDVEAEIAAAMQAARKARVEIRVLERYELPDGAGVRTLVELFA